jgi:hypothetical protein
VIAAPQHAAAFILFATMRPGFESARPFTSFSYAFNIVFLQMGNPVLAPSTRRKSNPIGGHSLSMLLGFASIVGGCGTVGRTYRNLMGKTHSVTITWERSASRVIGYNVYRTDAPGSNFTKLTSQPVFATKYTDFTVEAGKNYAYYVAAVNSNGLESKPSTTATAHVPSP